jgi:hypothetical protein
MSLYSSDVVKLIDPKPRLIATNKSLLACQSVVASLLNSKLPRLLPAAVTRITPALVTVIDCCSDSMRFDCHFTSPFVYVRWLAVNCKSLCELIAS